MEIKHVRRNAWEASTSRGNNLEGLKDKLKRVKVEVKNWNEEVVSSTKNRKQQLLAEIKELDWQDDDEILSEDMRVKRMDLLSQLRSLKEKDIAMLKQKARVEWLKSGDTNSKFYHSRLRWRTTKNDIMGLRINGVWCEEVPRVKCQVKEYFESRFGVNLLSLVNLDGVGFKSILAADNALLCDNISEVEVLEAVSQCGSSKCPGPDGFNFAFVKNYWEVIGKDFVLAIRNFQSTGFISRGCNASFITLIAKKNSLSNLNEFRPISLVGCVYKILSKIMANRLKKILPSIIDVNQSAFLSGRGLLDNILVANETVDYLKKEKKSGVIVKVDFEKAYDSVDWKFLYYMLGRLGFNCKWIKWLKHVWNRPQYRY